MSRLPFDMDGALRHLRRNDPQLKPLIREWGPPKLGRVRDTFEALSRSIVYQQVSGASAAAVYGRFRALYNGSGFPKPEQVLETPVEKLREAGLSRQKAAYIHHLAEKFADGTIRPRRFSRMTDDEIAQHLVQVKGIGQWSADMFLMFGLGRPDVLPVGDLGVKKGMVVHFELDDLPEEALMRELADRWAPYRSLGSWYMWRAVEVVTPD